MNRMGWAVALLVTSSAAGALGLATWKRWSHAPAAEGSPARRDPRQVGDVELSLILNKIREGDLLAIQGDLAGATRAWGDARRRGAGLWQVHEGIGDSYARAKLFDDAAREYATADALVPASMAAMRGGIRVKRALALERVGRHGEAFALLLDVDPPRIGHLYGLYGQGPNKREMMARLRRRAEADPRLLCLAAVLSEAEGATADAALAMAKYVRLVEPWNVGLARQVVEKLRGLGRVAQAIEVCRAWAKALPQDWTVYDLMGGLWLAAGDEKRAYLAYTSMVDVRPDDADAYRALGRALRAMGRVDEAVRAFEKSKSLRPEEPDRWIDVAETVAMRDPAAAEKLYDEIAKSNWDARFGNVVEAIRRRMAERLVRELEEARKRNDTARAREIRRQLAAYGVPEAAFDLKVVMTWDTRTDIDMDVIDPSGEHVEHSHPASKAGGRYWTDNTAGFGPETFTLAKASGTYRVGAHFHSGQDRTTVKFVVILFEDTDRERRSEHVLVFEKAGEQKFLPDLQVK
ncbi:MAG: tetratricopeptide repeat protein [Planctomycetes bacterium]|nr:tetratricopeptide repeat protein [Planctomycetota bacterium]